MARKVSQQQKQAQQRIEQLETLLGQSRATNENLRQEARRQSEGWKIAERTAAFYKADAAKALAETEKPVAVLRLIEYRGPRRVVEEQVRRSIHGTKEWGTGCAITAVTLHDYPEILEIARKGPEGVGEQASQGTDPFLLSGKDAKDFIKAATGR